LDNKLKTKAILNKRFVSHERKASGAVQNNIAQEGKKLFITA